MVKNGIGSAAGVGAQMIVSEKRSICFCETLLQSDRASVVCAALLWHTTPEQCADFEAGW